MKRLSLALAGALLLAACTAPVEEDEAATSRATSRAAFEIPEPEPHEADTPLVEEADDAVASAPWTSVGAGVAYKHIGAGSNVVIIYGGYTAQLEWVERWCNELYRVKGAALGLGHLYAVKGPNQSGYQNHEIENSRLAAHLGANGIAATASSIAVIAHSSGTYVADELFRHVKTGTGGVPAGTASKISYFDLDGGGPGDSTFVRRFAHAYFVWAYDGVIRLESHNAGGMKSLGASYASIGGGFEVVADRSGCDRSVNGGLWCMHDALINTRPHNPRMYDLKNDYTDFTSGRALVTSYLSALAP